MDLNSTLLRAQALFRRFQRTVDAIDKKHNFPLPPVHQRKPTSGSATSAGEAAHTKGTVTTGTDSRSRVVQEGTGKGRQGTVGNEDPVISVELRTLLRRSTV